MRGSAVGVVPRTPDLSLSTSRSRSVLLRALTPLSTALLHRFLSFLREERRGEERRGEERAGEEDRGRRGRNAQLEED